MYDTLSFLFGVQKIKSPRSAQNMQVRVFYDGLTQKSGKGNKISTCPKRAQILKSQMSHKHTGKCQQQESTLGLSHDSQWFNPVRYLQPLVG